MCEPQECWERVVADELEVGDIVAGLPEHSLGSLIKIRDIIRYNLTMEIHSDWGDDPIFRDSFVFRKKADSLYLKMLEILTRIKEDGVVYYKNSMDVDSECMDQIYLVLNSASERTENE